LFLTDRQYFSLAAVLLAPVAVLFVAVFALSAIQGLRLTWKKSRRNAVILVLGVLVVDLPAALIDGPSLNSRADVLVWLGSVFGVVGWWVLMAAVSEYLSNKYNNNFTRQQ
jgi:membrane glycosyltransferase